MRNTKKLIYLSPLVIVFLIIGFAIKGSTEGILFDVAILKLLHKNDNNVILNLMKFISFIGSWKTLIPGTIILGLYLLNKRKYYSFKLILSNILGSFVVNFILKGIFQRTRPLDFFRIEQGGLSFPSGHSMVSMSMYLSIAYLLTKNEKYVDKKRYIYMASIIMVLLMGISRMYLGVHWPTDIIGGYIMGYILFEISTILVK